mmetsp:Transcript_117074/g.203824  ORF Transcript_117074/g.203824 Transcript_117074/m.203824 type:complete len:87 (-) Transcript_117074:69-329(-)
MISPPSLCELEADTSVLCRDLCIKVEKKSETNEQVMGKTVQGSNAVKQGGTEATRWRDNWVVPKMGVVGSYHCVSAVERKSGEQEG